MIKNVIFDWDGTIIDNLPPVYEAVMHVFKKHGAKKISLEQYRQEFSTITPWMKFYNKHLPEITLEEETKSFKEGIEMVGESKFCEKIFPNTKETLELLHAKGIKMMVLSSAIEETVNKGVLLHGLKKYFTTIQTGALDKTQAIRKLLENGLEASETIIVGDSANDIQAGRDAGIKTVAVTYGFAPASVMKSMQPDHVIDDIKELETIINQ